MMQAMSTSSSNLQTVTLDGVYRAHFRFVWRILRRLGVRDAELEDAVQEVFLVVHRRLDSFDRTRPVKPWLAGIAHRVALAERRRARHYREQLSEGITRGDRAATGPSPEAKVEMQQRRARVMSALETMEPARRAVFVMYEMENMPCTEIATALDIPLNTVYSRLRLARERFKAALSRLRLQRGEA